MTARKETWANDVMQDRNAVEFATVAAQFCRYIEQAEGISREQFVDTLLKLLPLLYLKAALLPPYEETDEETEHYVTQEIYEVIRLSVADIMRDKDDYMDVFVEDMRYSDQPITQHVSENIADIYQDIKDFAFVFSLGVNDNMAAALYTCRYNFEHYWGQILLNVMRALHEAKYAANNE